MEAPKASRTKQELTLRRLLARIEERSTVAKNSEARFAELVSEEEDGLL